MKIHTILKDLIVTLFYSLQNRENTDRRASTRNKFEVLKNWFLRTKRWATHPPLRHWNTIPTVAQSKLAGRVMILFYLYLRFSYLADSGNRIKTSDSDFSDSEAGRTAKVGHVHGRIRQAALYLFYDVVKVKKHSWIFFTGRCICRKTFNKMHKISLY